MSNLVFKGFVEGLVFIAFLAGCFVLPQLILALVQS